MQSECQKSPRLSGQYAAPSHSPTNPNSETFSFGPILSSKVLEELAKLDSDFGSDALNGMFFKAFATVFIVHISRLTVSGDVCLSFWLENFPGVSTIQNGFVTDPNC